jgi:methanethiol S-methyltransferase
MESSVLEGRRGLARGLMTIYGIVVYAGFLALFVSMIGFVETIAVPRGIDDGAVAPPPVAIAVDLALLALFAVQHSVMARGWFKRWWTRFVPQPIERSTYVLASSAALALLIWQWQALPGTVWRIDGAVWRVAIVAASFAGWALVLGSTFLIDHFDMFGLRQVVRQQRGLPQADPPFQTRLLYRVVRHPLLLGLLIAVWAAPTMSLGHLLFAGAVIAYIAFGVRLEERDLTAIFGDRYRRYRREVPMLLPGTRGPLEGAPIVPVEGASAREAQRVRLADGAELIVRRLVSSDEESIRAFYRGLSPSTLGRRFLTPYSSLPESMLRYLAVADRPDRCVIVATHGGAIVGEARFHRSGGSDDNAEVAVVVADDWQGRGLGTALAQQLARLARESGLTAFTGSMAADNRAAVGLLTAMAPDAGRRVRSGELEFRTPLPVPGLPTSRPSGGRGRAEAVPRTARTRATYARFEVAGGVPHRPPVHREQEPIV